MKGPFRNSWRRPVSSYYVFGTDFVFNPALGTGQIQIKDIHCVSFQRRTTWDFCQLLDKLYLNSSRRSEEDWIREARKGQWIKD